MAKEILTADQRKKLEALWFIYGNGGKKATLGNHKFIQGLLEHGENNLKTYKDGYQNMIDRFGKKTADEKKLTDECVEAVMNIINNP